MLVFENSGRQCLDRVIIEHLHHSLHHDRAVVKMLIHYVHGAAGEFDPVFKRLALRVQAREKRVRAKGGC